MSLIKKPMLAATCEDKSLIKFPVLATPKLDGIRCLVIDGKAVTRKFKDVPNHYIRRKISLECPEGLDGEIVIPTATFNEISSSVMSEEGKPNFKFYVFDYVSGTDHANLVDGLHKPYWKRMEELAALEVPDFVVKVLPRQIESLSELDALEEKFLNAGYEGVMIRSAHSPYKCNRSTAKEGYLLKIKRFRDAEATIIGFEERMHNENEAKIDELGHTKRSSHKENMVPAGTLGDLLVKDVTSGIEFKIGTGFDDALRAEIWGNKEKYQGKLVKYKHQEAGKKDKPRFPVFLGFRDERDIS